MTVSHVCIRHVYSIVVRVSVISFLHDDVCSLILYVCFCVCICAVIFQSHRFSPLFEISFDVGT